MAVINDPNTAGNIAAVGEKASGATGALHVVQKPLPFTVGHYRTQLKFVLATSQAANSRLFEIRNSSTNFIVPTRMFVQAGAAGTITTGYLGEIGIWRVTGFTVVDTTNTVTPTSSVRRTTGMTAYPGNAQVRHVTLTGVAGGMTGGTLTKDGNQVGSLMFPAFTLAGTTPVVQREMFDDVNGTHPFVLAQNEGLIVENVVVGSGTANVVHVVMDFSWAEVTAF